MTGATSPSRARRHGRVFVRRLPAAFRIALLLAAIPAVLVPRAAADPADDRNGGPIYRTVRDVENRFTIDVPAGWKVTTSRGDPALSALGPALDGGLPASLVVIVRDLPLPITPETCVYEAQYVMRRAIQRYASLSVGPDRLGELPAWSHAYTWTAKTGEERRSIQVCVTIGRRAILTIGTTANRPVRLHDDMPALTRSIQSLHPAAAPAEPERPRAGESK